MIGTIIALVFLTPVKTKIRSQKYAINSTKILSDSEFSTLVTVCMRDLRAQKPRFAQSEKERARPRNALLILVALKSGGRAQEVLNLKKGDFNPTTGSVLIRGLKGSNDREVPLPEWLATALDQYLRMQIDARVDRIFPITYPRLNQIWNYYRPTKKTFHALRHTFAIQVYQHTKDIKLVQLALGHRSILNTMVYLDYVYSIEQMKKIVF